jgi:hypothetical protein
MKLKLKNTPEQVELIKQMGSKDLTKAAEAQEVFAAFLGPVIQEVIRQAGTLSAIYTDSEFDEDDSPSYPLDLYYDQSDGYIKVWSQNVAGGLPSSLVEGMKEMKIATYRLDSAVSFLKKYARRGRLDIISKAVERMAQEVLVKQERNGWAVIMKALAEASTLKGRANSSASALNHILQSNTNDQFVLDDMNRLLTLQRRLFTSFAGGSPEGSRGITDLFVSPEILEQVRAFAYQPMNTRAGVLSGTSAEGYADSSVALPDSVREQVFRGAGMGEIYGISLHEVIELGVNQKYNTLFDTFAGATTYPASGGSTFDGSSSGDEILVGLDASRDAFIRPVARQHESGGQWTVLADDQWVSRSEKTGFYGYLEEGRVCIDARAVVGIIV